MTKIDAKNAKPKIIEPASFTKAVDLNLIERVARDMFMHSKSRARINLTSKGTRDHRSLSRIQWRPPMMRTLIAEVSRG